MEYTIAVCTISYVRTEWEEQIRAIVAQFTEKAFSTTALQIDADSQLAIHSTLDNKNYIDCKNFVATK